MIFILLNCSVHVIMYSYYFLSTFPNLQRRLVPFKKWITRIQMGHILFLTVISLESFNPSCDKSAKYFGAMSFLNCTINLLFFFNFYTSYKKSKTA
ncbi:PREDICTED: elongation of very long chain fatty acids protein 1-like [Wasmannia auropunctata]|uniref:elongation of very long chain fatty acids protein 1-like n=1 Tax=Wasmannia auropunctata TaxID=64793 RepID=UPI0005EF9805|nr:PREDICTED: elongation of very long chain fatty acids protein 1-like [Wasmannia auropunctata]